MTLRQPVMTADQHDRLRGAAVTLESVDVHLMRARPVFQRRRQSFRLEVVIEARSRLPTVCGIVRFESHQVRARLVEPRRAAAQIDRTARRPDRFEPGDSLRRNR